MNILYIFLIIIFIIVLYFLYNYYFNNKYNREKHEEKEQKKNKILELAKKQEFITNNEVEELLKIGDSTTTRYLGELAEEGKLLREGGGKSVKYKIN